MNKARGMGTYLSLKFYETVVRDNLRKQVAKMKAYLLKIEMLQTAIAGIMKENHYQHNFCL
ncbi:hypothetical protein LO761_06445 [Bacteroidaceae bacterium 14-104]|nr:hypothetical protein [Phocaeicola oris]MCE2616548.1 hypothetical protein [Phocaeicola oris]